jgi:hypothetical protein
MSPDGCRGERSTLASAAPSARLASHPWQPRRIRTGHRLRWFRTRTTTRPRRLPLVSSPTSRSEQAHTRSLLRLPALAPHPSHPLRIDLPRQGRGRRMRLPRRRSARLSAHLAATGKMRLPNVCNRLTTRVPYRTARFSNHRLPPLSPGGRLPQAPTRPKPCRRCDRVEIV